MASKIVNARLVHFPYDIKLRLLAHSRSNLANQKARNAIVGAENLLNSVIMVRILGNKLDGGSHFLIW